MGLRKPCRNHDEWHNVACFGLSIFQDEKRRRRSHTCEEGLLLLARMFVCLEEAMS